MAPAQPWWADDLTAEERRILDPGPDAVDATPDVLVVGGGVVGLATAVMCVRAELGRVQVIERDRLGSGPSGSAAGGLTPGIHAIARPPEFATLAARGLVLHRALDDEWGGACALRATDWLIVSPDRIAPDSLSVPSVEIVDAAAAHTIEPSLAPVGGALLIRDQSWAHPQRVVAAFASRAGSVSTGVAMTGVVTRAERVVRVDTTAGPVSPGVLVVATGAITGDLAAVPQRSVKGHLLVTAPIERPPRAAVASSILVLPLADGRLLAGGTFEPEDHDPTVRDDTVASIRGEVARLFPSAARVEVERAWCCFRPGTPDEMPVIDRIPGLENAWMNVAHYRTGLLVAPGAGEALASWIATGVAPDELAAFASSRFG